MSDLGTLVEIDGRPALRFERWLPAPVERVWRAATDEDEMRAWFPSRVEGERVVGASLRFPFDDGEAPTFEGEVIDWDPPRVFAFTWNGDLLRIELAPAGDGTALVFTQVLHDRTEAARTGAGWHACLDTLAAHLGGMEGSPGDPLVLFAEYVRHAGPPLARNEGGLLVFERTHHLAPDELRDAVDRWGHSDGATFTIQPTQYGSSYEVEVPAGTPGDAARWHAALVEFDMYAASGQRVAVEAEQFVDDYRRLLA